MLKSLRIVTGILVVASTALVGVSGQAVACEGRDCDDDGGSDGESGDGTITVTVWGSGTTNGGGGYEIPRDGIRIPVPCYYSPLMTGKEYFEYVESGDAARTWRGTGGEGPFEPHPGYEQYKDDDEGHWWGASCSSETFGDDLDEFFEYSEDWFENEYDGPIYIEPGEPEPVPPIPPELLMQVAYDEMDIPEAKLEWNPKRDGDNMTFVHAETWVWLEDSPITLEVNAEAGGNTATVTAQLTETTVDSPDAEAVTCEGTGVEWSPGASAGCVMEFVKSSARHSGEKTPVTIETTWEVEWSANGEPQGPLDPQTMTSETTIPVAEIQGIITE